MDATEQDEGFQKKNDKCVSRTYTGDEGKEPDKKDTKNISSELLASFGQP